MRRVNGSSCALGGTLVVALLFCASICYGHATTKIRWQPKWDNNFKRLLYNNLLRGGILSPESKLSRRSISTGNDAGRDRDKKMMDPSSSGILLGGHSTTSAFRLRRKKRGSFRLKKKMPLSYLDYYYALGSGGQNFLDEGLDNGLSIFNPMKTAQNEPHDESLFEEEKRGSFRLKKNQQSSSSVFLDKRASFRLKRILDNYGSLIGSRPAGSSSAFRLKKRGGASSFRLKRGPQDEDEWWLYQGG